MVSGGHGCELRCFCGVSPQGEERGLFHFGGVGDECGESAVGEGVVEESGDG